MTSIRSRHSAFTGSSRLAAASIRSGNSADASPPGHPTARCSHSWTCVGAWSSLGATGRSSGFSRAAGTRRSIRRGLRTAAASSSASPVAFGSGEISSSLRSTAPRCVASRARGTTTWSRAWSPTGSLIAFSSDRPVRLRDDREIVAVRPDGTGVRKLTANDVFQDRAPAWSPDGSRIVFESGRDPARLSPALWTMRSDGSRRAARPAHVRSERDTVVVRDEPQRGRPTGTGSST